MHEFNLLYTVLTIVGVLVVIPSICGFLIYAERKVSAWVQDRVGPNRVGPLGLLQSLADGLKFILKEDVIPRYADRFLFVLAPCIAILTPMLAPVLVYYFGWRVAFLITGALVFVWLIVWWKVYRSPREKPNLSAAELAHIESDPADTPGKVPWLSLLRHRQTWAYALGKFIIDPIWWFFLFWLPSFFASEHGLDLMTFGPALVAIYIISDVGSVAGSILLLLRSRHAVTAFVISLVGAVLSFIYQMTIDLPPAMDSTMNKVMPLVIVGAIVLQWWYARRMRAAGVLR